MKLGGYQRAGVLAARTLPKRPHGFTIVETLIVLAVTGVLFLAAVLLVNGRQNRTQFMTAINGFQQQMQQIINETANGVYPRDTAYSCVKGVAAPPQLSIQAVADRQGQNAECIFLGKAIQFGVQGTDPQTYQVIPIVGNRMDASGANSDVEASTLYGGTSGAYPEPAMAGDVHNLGIQGEAPIILQHGLTVTKMWYGTDPSDVNAALGTIAFLSTLPSPSGTGIASGSQTLGLYRVMGSKLQESTPKAVERIYPDGTTPLVAVSSVSICVASGTTNQSGLVVIGANDSSAATSVAVNLTIKSGQTCGVTP